MKITCSIILLCTLIFPVSSKAIYPNFSDIRASAQRESGKVPIQIAPGPYIPGCQSCETIKGQSKTEIWCQCVSTMRVIPLNVWDALTRECKKKRTRVVFSKGRFMCQHRLER